MKVKELMTPDVECTRPDASIQQAADRMKSLDVGSMPVCHQDRLVGMITDRDIVLRSVSEGHDPEVDHVQDAMTSDLVYCFEDQDVNEAARVMQDNQVRRLPVLNRNKRLVGIISLGDIAVENVDNRVSEATLEAISEPPKR